MTKLQTILVSNLRKYRKRKNLTQLELAEICDVSTNYIGEIESGRKYPSAAVLQKLVWALDLKPYMLLASEDDLEVYDRRELLELYKERLIKKISDDFSDIKKKLKDKEKVNSDKD